MFICVIYPGVENSHNFFYSVHSKVTLTVKTSPKWAKASRGVARMIIGANYKQATFCLPLHTEWARNIARPDRLVQSIPPTSYSTYVRTNIRGLQCSNLDGNQVANDRYWQNKNVLMLAKCMKLDTFLSVCILSLPETEISRGGRPLVFFQSAIR